MESLPPDASEFLGAWLGTEWTAERLAGDASIRAYYRVTTAEGRHVMFAWYPESLRANLARFLAVYGELEGQVPVPRVLSSCALGVVQEDVGDETLYDLLHRDRARAIGFYREAIDQMIAFQAAGRRARELNPPFDAATFAAELTMTARWYVERMAGLAANAGLDEIFDRLASSIAAHPYVLCHRDYHGQNIHILNGTLYIIDYQDMRIGPDTYDLASLLRDRGVAALLGRETEEALVDSYRRAIGADAALRHRYFEVLLQRTIKTIGTFARQALERGRLHYLDFIPPALDSVRRCVEELPGYGAMRELFPMSLDRAAVERMKRELAGAAGITDQER